MAADDRVFDLTNVPGIELDTRQTFQLMPIVSALRNNRWFTELHLLGVPRRDAVKNVADALRFNQ